MDTAKVICKIDKQGEALLFFPEYDSTKGFIACWQFVGQHSEASIGYYTTDVRNPRNSAEEKKIDDAIRVYELGYDVKCIRVKKQSAKMRKEAWK